MLLDYFDRENIFAVPCFFVNNGQTNNFRLYDEQTVNRLRKIARASVFHLMSPCLHVHVSMSSCPCLRVHVSVSMSPCLCLHFSTSPSLWLSVSMSPCLCPCPCLHVSEIPQTENGTNGKWQHPFVCCRRKTETANFRLFAANGNGKGKCVLHSRQKTNDNRR
jgi:hypothetical protein